MATAARNDSRVSFRSVQSEKVACAAVFLGFAWLSLTCPTKAYAAESKAPSEWIIQQNEDGSGLNSVYVTNDAVKIVNTHLGCQMIIKAPDWKIHCFQTKEKIEWVGKLEQFSGDSMINPYSTPSRPAAAPLEVIGTGTMKGLQYLKYPVNRSAILVVAKDIHIAPQAADFISRFYGSPYVQAMPLYSCAFLKGEKLNASQQKNPWIDMGMTNDLRTGLRVNLETLSSKRVAYNAADFELPRNYKRTVSLTAVTLSGDKKSQFRDMLDSVGFTTNVGKDKQNNEIRKSH